jgi:uncharacterized protein (DUF2062 family)
MFKRRMSQPLTERLAAVLWPRGGWGRAGQYLMHRLSRLPGTPYSLAAGFAAGAAVSFTPLIGLHFFLGAIVAWIIRANIVASAIGTIIGNPWTFPLIWLWLYNLGHWIMQAVGLEDGAAAAPPKFGAVFDQLWHAVLSGEWSSIVETSGPVLGPMLLASVPTALLVWIAVFWGLKPIVGRYQARRRRIKRRKEMAKGTLPIAEAGS